MLLSESIFWVGASEAWLTDKRVGVSREKS